MYSTMSTYPAREAVCLSEPYHRTWDLNKTKAIQKIRSRMLYGLFLCRKKEGKKKK